MPDLPPLEKRMYLVIFQDAPNEGEAYVEHAGLIEGVFDFTPPLRPQNDAEFRMAFWLRDHFHKPMHRFTVIDYGPAKDFSFF